LIPARSLSIVIVATLAGSAFASAASPPFAIKGRFDDKSTAYTATGTVPIEVREVRFDAMGPYGDFFHYRLLVEFESKSGSFFWVVAGDDADPSDESRQIRALKNDHIAILRGSCLANLLPETNAALYVREICGHATNLEDAESIAFSAAEKLNNPPGSLERVDTWRRLTIDGLGRDFLTSPDSAAVPSAGPKVRDVSWDGKHWIVTLEGRWLEQVVIDAEYDIVSEKKIE
jgi:hypothetical protein